MVMTLLGPAAVMTAIMVLLLDDDHVLVPTVPTVVPGVCGRAAGKRHTQSHHSQCDKREYDSLHSDSLWSYLFKRTRIPSGLFQWDRLNACPLSLLVAFSPH